MIKELHNFLHNFNIIVDNRRMKWGAQIFILDLLLTKVKVRNKLNYLQIV